MGASCSSCSESKSSPKLILWAALILNFAMFLVEVAASFMANSMSLRADSIDFLGDSANYGVSLFVLSMGLAVRAKASLLKAATMTVFGVWVVISSIYYMINNLFPKPEAMGLLGITALVVNLIVAILLFKFRNGDSNMKSVWLCTRNDVIGNLAVILAASGVFMTSSKWPDLAVAIFMGLLAIHSSYAVFIVARQELNRSLA